MANQRKVYRSMGDLLNSYGLKKSGRLNYARSAGGAKRVVFTANKQAISELGTNEVLGKMRYEKIRPQNWNQLKSWFGLSTDLPKQIFIPPRGHGLGGHGMDGWSFRISPDLIDRIGAEIHYCPPMRTMFAIDELSVTIAEVRVLLDRFAKIDPLTAGLMGSLVITQLSGFVEKLIFLFLTRPKVFMVTSMAT
ncbi:MAG: hypothetical protein ABIL58_12840 [Pseudomonadota bacterium]